MIKKRFLSMLVLLAAVVTGAMAQTTYKVSVKEGTEGYTIRRAKKVDVTGVTLLPTTATLTLGETETVTLTATVLPGDATKKNVTWSSSNEAVATVSNEGVVTAVAAGEATITVTATNGTDVTTDDQTATCTVTVTAPAAPAPAWLLEGDEWDDATKTLTVNSNPVDYAYSGGLSVIENLVISDAVTSIGASAFAMCTGLTSVTIPNNVISIGVAAFAACSGLTSMVVASGNTKYDSRDNCNAIIEKSTNTLIAGCQNTIIPNSVTSIGLGAFLGCTGLTSITIPSSVTSIGDGAFQSCI